MKTLVTDIGYGDTKFAWKEGEKTRFGKFPTAIVRRGRARVYPSMEGIGSVSLEMVFEGISYVVGEQAFDFGKPISTRRKGFIPTYAPLLVAKMVKEAGKDFERLVVSVAISDYTREHVEALKKRLQKFTVNDKDYSFKNILVLPQGYGIYRDVFPEGTDKKVVVVDIGFNTIDISYYVGGEPIKDNFRGLPGYGAARIINNLLEKVKEETGEQISELELNKAIKEGGKLKFYSREYDISDLIEEEKEFYAEEVIAEIESSLGDVWKRADYRIIAGGGGYFIPEDFKKEYSLTVPESPEFSNVRGFLTAVKGE